MDYTKSPKISKKFHCEKCDYTCSKHCEFNKHLTTAKHNKDDAEDILEDNKISIQYICIEK
jgi:hypothetical protein